MSMLENKAIIFNAQTTRQFIKTLPSTQNSLLGLRASMASGIYSEFGSNIKLPLKIRHSHSKTKFVVT